MSKFAIMTGMIIKNLDELNTYLEQFVPGSIMDGDFYNPNKMYELLEVLGNPQDNYKVVHVAGTSGKTSTCYYISAMLKSMGLDVGLTVSPHIFTINERVQINGKPLDEKEMCEFFTTFMGSGVVEKKPTYFELILSFALWVFAKKGCEYVVLEVGLGGLKDATNVIEDPSKIAVITDIGLDHTRILGDTIEKIAFQKAGIIKSNNHVFCYTQGSVVNEVIDERIKKNDATLHRFQQNKLGSNTEFATDLPDYQKRNWLLARAVVEYISNRDNKQINQKGLIRTQNVQIPGRMQKIKVGNKLVILDGAHNPQKLRAFVNSLKQMYPDKNFGLLIAFMQSKESMLDESLKILHELSKDVITTHFEGSSDLVHAVIPASELAVYCHKAEFESVDTIDSPFQAYDKLLKQSPDILIVTGSFYLIAALAEKVRQYEHD